MYIELVNVDCVECIRKVSKFWMCIFEVLSGDFVGTINIDLHLINLILNAVYESLLKINILKGW